MNPKEYANILLVDDQPQNIVSLENHLHALDTHIITATSGEECLVKLLENDVALILLDVEMPDMDGFKTAEKIRGNKETRHIPIIFTTDISKEKKHIFKGYESGAVDYLFKPVDVDILLNKVRVYIDLYQQKIVLKTMNERLQQANRKILEQQKSVIEEERLKVLLQMAGATAHELNQPLMALLGSIELLELVGQVPDNLVRHIENIKKAATRISNVVKKIQFVKRHEVSQHDSKTNIINLDQTIKIIYVVEADSDFAMIKNLFADEKLELIRARTIEQAFDTLNKNKFDLIFCDHLLPDGNGFDFIVKAGQMGIEAPIVILTENGDEMLAAQLIQSGAYDFLLKRRVSKPSLIRTVKNSLEKAHLISEVNRAQEKLAELTKTDDLTGLFNRRCFDEAILQEVLRGDRYKIDFSLCFMDLDQFKEINDKCGHSSGDMALKKIGELLKTNFRQTDLIFRYSGQKFAIILPHTKLQDAVKACEKFQKTLADFVFSYQHFTFKVTACMGISSYNNSSPPSRDQIIVNAEQALFKSKKAGKNKLTA